jgi:hypothetical protein
VPTANGNCRTVFREPIKASGVDQVIAHGEVFEAISTRLTSRPLLLRAAAQTGQEEGSQPALAYIYLLSAGELGAGSLLR